jgi:hypothetical protein
MAKDIQKSSATSTGPPNIPVNPPSIPLAALDQSFVLQMMLDLKGSVEGLKGSVDNLKEQSKEHGQEIKLISKDVHAAKVVGAFIVLTAGFLGFFIKLLVDYLSAHK